jgi:hypothetical protein
MLNLLLFLLSNVYKLLMMYTMKKLQSTLALVFFLMIGLTSTAQEKATLSDDKKQEIREQMKMDKERLALTDAQEVTYKEITKKYGAQLKTLRDGSDKKRDKFRKVKEIQEQKNTEMKGLLSEAQYKTYLELQEERRAKMKEMRN